MKWLVSCQGLWLPCQPQDCLQSWSVYSSQVINLALTLLWSTLNEVDVLWSSFFAMNSYHPRAALVIYHQFSIPLSLWKHPRNTHYHVGNSQVLLVFLSCYLLSPTIICYTPLPPTPRLVACSWWTATTSALF